MSHITRSLFQPFAKLLPRSKTIVPHTTGQLTDRYDTHRTRLLLLGVIAVMGSTYIWLVNSSTAASFKAADLREQVASLDDEYQRLLVAKSQAESLGRLQEFATAHHMEVTTATAYAQTPSTVALSQ
jgi:hypothetical protein